MTPSAASDLDDALRAARAGDPAGFAVLWEAMQPAVLRYLRVVVGDVAEDVASETWLHAVRDLPSFSGDAAAFRVWLFRLARHRGIDEQRRVGRRREDPHNDLPDVPAIAGDAAGGAFDGLDTRWALKVIASLPRHQAEVIMLRVVAGLDVGQTAAVLGRRRGAVRVAALRGLRQLAMHPEVRARQAMRGAGRAQAQDSVVPAAWRGM